MNTAKLLAMFQTLRMTEFVNVVFKMIHKKDGTPIFRFLVRQTTI